MTSITSSQSSSRFSALLSPSISISGSSSRSVSSTSAVPSSSYSTGLSTSGSTSTLPALPPNAAVSKRTTSIYDRSVVKSKGSEVALGAWAFLFSEIIQYTQRRVSGIGEFEKRLNILGYRVGARLHELLPLRETLYPSSLSSLRSAPPPVRLLRLLPLLSYLHSPLYRYLFNRAADSLEKSTENEDEYMIGDNDMMITRAVEVPKEMSELSCGALVAGIIEAVMDGAGFPARVTAHAVPTLAYPRRTVILIKLDASVMARESAMGST